MEVKIEDLTGNSLTWAIATAEGWEATNSEALRKIGLCEGEEFEEFLMPGDQYPSRDARGFLEKIRAKHGSVLEVPSAWS